MSSIATTQMREPQGEDLGQNLGPAFFRLPEPPLLPAPARGDGGPSFPCFSNGPTHIPG